MSTLQGRVSSESFDWEVSIHEAGLQEVFGINVTGSVCSEASPEE